MNKNVKIPYIIINKQNKRNSYVEHNSVLEYDLEETLLNELKSCMDNFEFFDSLQEDDIDANVDVDLDVESLMCDECGCVVTSKKYIHINSDSSKTCGACTDFVITKEIYDKFLSFLDKKGIICNILYFKNNQWSKFVIYDNYHDDK
jgi:hypothetical protein